MSDDQLYLMMQNCTCLMSDVQRPIHLKIRNVPVKCLPPRDSKHLTCRTPLCRGSLDHGLVGLVGALNLLYYEIMFNFLPNDFIVTCLYVKNIFSLGTVNLAKLCIIVIRYFVKKLYVNLNELRGQYTTTTTTTIQYSRVL